jgi:outer membrane protein OmpA-like peptidoglycan-associated protein
VLNHQDRCRTEPSGTHPDRARPGCPLPDHDHDSVLDANDACPDRAGAPSLDPRRNGCPGLVLVSLSNIRILQQIRFANRSDRILPASDRVLQAVSEAMRSVPEIRRVSVDGHTDNVGDDAANLQLSDRRAASVRAWLVAHGVDAGRLESHGYGETRPIESNRTRRGRAANRRVEFRILDPAPPPQPAGGDSR